MSRVLAIDLGTSRVKVALVDVTLRVFAAAAEAYPTTVDQPGQAEQEPAHWLRAVAAATERVLDAESAVDAVVLTGQLPTLVAVDEAGHAQGPAVTWQDSRADALVEARLTAEERRRVAAVSGAPIDGRYVVPMHLRQAAEGAPEPATLLSAKDYLFLALTGTRATEPSTASGYGALDVDAGRWSAELLAIWGVAEGLLPPVVDAHHVAPLAANTLTGVAPGTPVVVGAADSVCAHHYITSCCGDGIAVIDGSSTVIMTELDAATPRPTDLLVTPLVAPGSRGVELDLLATGSSLGWLAGLLHLTPSGLEDLALAHPDPAGSAALALPYLAGGEQGALWRSDLTGTLAGLTLATTAQDLAWAIFEGIAFETVRCLNRLADGSRRVLAVSPPDSRHLRTAIVAATWPGPVAALAEASPSVLGAALIAFDALGVAVHPAPAAAVLPPNLGAAYLTAAAERMTRYFEAAPVLSAPPLRP